MLLQLQIKSGLPLPSATLFKPSPPPALKSHTIQPSFPPLPPPRRRHGRHPHQHRQHHPGIPPLPLPCRLHHTLPAPGRARRSRLAAVALPGRARVGAHLHLHQVPRAAGRAGRGHRARGPRGAPRPGVPVPVAPRRRRAVGLLCRPHAPRRGEPAGHGAGAPGQRRLRRPPRQGRRARAPLPPRHGLRPLGRLLARAAPHQLRAPLQPAQRGRGGAAPRRHRRAHAAGPPVLLRRRRRGGHAARSPRGVAGPRDGHRVRRTLRRRQPRGRGAGGDGEGRVRPARPVQLGRPPAAAPVAGPAGRQEEVQEPGEQGERVRRQDHPRAQAEEEGRRRRRQWRPGRRRLRRRLARIGGRREAVRLRHDRRSLGDDLSGDGHGGDPAGVGDGADGAAPGDPEQGAGGAGRRRGPGPGPLRLRRRRGAAAVPAAGREGDAARAPAGPAAVVGAPGRARRGGRRPPGPGGHHGHGQHVGHRARPGRVGGPRRVPAGEVRGGGRRRARRRPPARAVRRRAARLPRQDAGARHRPPLARAAAAPLPVGAGGRRRRPGRAPRHVARDGEAPRVQAHAQVVIVADETTTNNYAWPARDGGVPMHNYIITSIIMTTSVLLRRVIWLCGSTGFERWCSICMCVCDRWN